jgi:hypothetical protein
MQERRIAKMRSLTILVLAALFAGSASANGFIVLYDNTNAPAADTFTSLSYSAGPYDGIGDSITLASPGTASDAFLQLFNNGTDGTFDASLLFFNAGAPVGTQIGTTYTQTGLTAGANSYVNLAFNNLNLVLPANIVYILELTNVTSGVDLGLELYSGAAAGSNISDTAIVLQGSSFMQTSTGDTGAGNPAFELTELTPTPEPSTWLLAGLGLFAAVWKSRRPLLQRVQADR